MKLSQILSLDGRAWSANFCNVAALALQLYTVVATRNVGGLNLGMLVIFLYVQITFAQVGYRDKSRALFWGMALSVAIIAIVFLSRF